VSSLFQPLDELCPNCGNFVAELNEITGFCSNCNTAAVGTSSKKSPHSSPNRLELWLRDNAARIEGAMIDYNLKAKYAIKIVIAQEAVVCSICGDVINHATPGRHFLCDKKPQCKRARRYYKYLRFEKGVEKDQAIAATIFKFKTRY
jgi:hypothetical protein